MIRSESNDAIYTLPSVEEPASGNVLSDPEEPELGLCGGLEGWLIGRGGARGASGRGCVHSRLVPADGPQESSQHCNYPPIKDEIRGLKET